MSVEQTKAKVEALRAEIEQLQASINIVAAQHNDAHAALSATLATAERSPKARGIDHQQAIATAEQDAGGYADALRRKQAALAAAQAELAQAELDADRAAVQAEFDQLYIGLAEMREIAAQLDHDTLNVELWLKLVAVTRRDAQRFTGLRRRAGAGHPIVDPYADPLATLRGICEHVCMTAERKLEPGGAALPIVPVDVAGALRLAFVGPRIDTLKDAVFSELE